MLKRIDPRTASRGTPQIMEKECSERRDIVRTEQERDNDCFKPCKYPRGKTVVSTVNNKTIIVFSRLTC